MPRTVGTPPPPAEREQSQSPPAAAKADAPPVRRPAAGDGGRRGRRRPRRSLWVRLEAFISQLSTRNNFWHRVCSLIWLPYAFHSGIRMKKVDARTFQAVLPFRRFNRNWYNAMAGAALLGNAEIAGGSYIFGVCGANYTVVCKRLEYKFLRPCLGPAVYRIEPDEDIEALVASGKEFNLNITMHVVQQIRRPSDKEKRVGLATATFHVTPKAHQRTRGRLK